MRFLAVHMQVRAAQVNGDMAALEVRIKKLVVSSNEQNDAMQYVSEKTMLEEWKWSKARAEAVKKYCFKHAGRFWKYDKYERHLQLFLATTEKTVHDKLLAQDTCEAEMEIEPSHEAVPMLTAPQPLFGVSDMDDQQKKDTKKRAPGGGPPAGSANAVKKAKTFDNEFRSDMTSGIAAAAGVKVELGPVPFSSDLVQEDAECLIMIEGCG